MIYTIALVTAVKFLKHLFDLHKIALLFKACKLYNSKVSLTLSHSERPKLYGVFGHSECQRVNIKMLVKKCCHYKKGLFLQTGSHRVKHFILKCQKKQTKNFVCKISKKCFVQAVHIENSFKNVLCKLFILRIQRTWHI